ncbi:hypothetical protein BC936DRAFT_142557 [Jimgerdemannia flammicorona]|uniref:Uncharacterized protein n=1 Tax=Jimgerdemannia flammicorona TaxID=994334 RepID=A0A433A085_9FUNG|nr:hypothetical protein BC936DRAFT_142557 [Jimgerdemannia flammicorona]
MKQRHRVSEVVTVHQTNQLPQQRFELQQHIITLGSSKLQMPTHHVIRQGLPSEDDAVAENFYKMWLDMGYSSDSLVENWRQKTLDRLQVARRDLKMMTFVAMAVGDDAAETVVGNAIVQLWDGGYRTELHFFGVGIAFADSSPTIIPHDPTLKAYTR